MLGKMVKKFLSYMLLFLLTTHFGEYFISEVKEPAYFSMLESWYNKIVNKNVKAMDDV